MSRPDLSRPLNILLIDDDPRDILLTQEALQGFEIPHRLFVVENGQEAFQFLRNAPPYENLPSPGLVLLDLNMPVMDGRDFLKTLKADPEFGHIPVVVFSGYTGDAEVVASYQAHANSFVGKPVNWARFKAHVRGIVEFWFHTPELPA